VKHRVDLSVLAGQRLVHRRQGGLDDRAGFVRQSMRDALARLDFREARRHVELLQAMRAGAERPLSETEQTALFARLRKQVEEAVRRRVPDRDRTPGAEEPS